MRNTISGSTPIYHPHNEPAPSQPAPAARAPAPAPNVEHSRAPNPVGPRDRPRPTLTTQANQARLQSQPQANSGSADRSGGRSAPQHPTGPRMRTPQAPRQPKPQSTNVHAQQAPQASGSGRNMWNDVDVDTFQEIVGYLPAKSKAAFAGTSGVFNKSEALKGAGKEFKGLMDLLKPLNRGSRINPNLIDQGLAMLDRRMHPEDQQKLISAVTNAVTIQVGKLSERTLTAQEADATLQQAHHLLGKVQDPLKLLGLVSNISAQLGTIDPSSPRCPHALLASMRQIISSVPLAPHTAGAEMNNDAINLAFAVSGLNRFGLTHLPEAQRAPAFSHHIAAMQRLYASGFRTTVPMFHPMSSALRQVPLLPVEHRAEAQFKLNQLTEWRS